MINNLSSLSFIQPHSNATHKPSSNLTDTFISTHAGQGISLSGKGAWHDRRKRYHRVTYSDEEEDPRGDEREIRLTIVSRHACCLFQSLSSCLSFSLCVLKCPIFSFDECVLHDFTHIYTHTQQKHRSGIPFSSLPFLYKREDKRRDVLDV